jgi:hypothetical protein
MYRDGCKVHMHADIKKVVLLMLNNTQFVAF